MWHNLLKDTQQPTANPSIQIWSSRQTVNFQMICGTKSAEKNNKFHLCEQILQNKSRGFTKITVVKLIWFISSCRQLDCSHPAVRPLYLHAAHHSLLLTVHTCIIGYLLLQRGDIIFCLRAESPVGATRSHFIGAARRERNWIKTRPTDRSRVQTWCRVKNACCIFILARAHRKCTNV